MSIYIPAAGRFPRERQTSNNDDNEYIIHIYGCSSAIVINPPFPLSNLRSGWSAKSQSVVKICLGGVVAKQSS